MKAPAFWRERDAGALALLLRPASWVYGAIAARRMARPGARAAAPVVTIGNFDIGGAGKTPTAIAVAQLLRALGRKPAFLSRGYGGSLSHGAPVRVTEQSAREVGDEPLLLARHATTFVGVDRAAAATRVLAETDSDVLVLDDGLQSRRLEPDLALAAVDTDFGSRNGLCLPAGPLRAPLAAQLLHVHALVAIGSGDAADETVAAARRAGLPVLRARLEPEDHALAGEKVVAFAGIARPEKFFRTLQEIGADITERRAFPDHHAYAPDDLRGLSESAAARNALLVTTEKDYVRLPAEFRQEVRTLPVRLRFEDEAAALKLLEAALRK